MFVTAVGLAMTLALIITAAGPVAAVDRVLLRTASSFAVLAGSTVTNTGPSVIKATSASALEPRSPASPQES
jgi:hypothetical protein